MKREEFSRPVDLKQIKVTDTFWHREQELVRTQVIPYQWEALNDRVPGASPSYCMRNFKTAGRLIREQKQQGSAFQAPKYTYRGFEALPAEPGKLEDDKFYGFVFQDSDFSKWIEAVGYSLACYPDGELERTADEAIDIVCAAQLPDGYLDTYYIINGMDKALTNLKDHHELYCLGHLVEGAVAYYQATGKDKLLEAAKRFADYISLRFGPEEGKCKGYPGHEIAEMALVRLYEVTGEEKYLKLSRFFLDMRGTQPHYFDLEEMERMDPRERAVIEKSAGDRGRSSDRYAYHQAHKPVREQDEAVGHAVRAVYLYSGMADVARLTGDEDMYQACVRLWESITGEKMYVTGGIGGTHIGEAFSHAYDLPNDTAYSETCAAIGLAFFARRMLEIRADRKYSDVMERALYNTVLSGMSLDGKSFFYVNPLEVVPEDCRRDERKAHVKPVRQKWFGCACCPPNIARIISSIGSYAYTEKEDTLWVHLYMGGSLVKKVGDRSLKLQVETDMPWGGNTSVTVQGEDGPLTATLAFRLPGWCKGGKVRLIKGAYRQEIQWEELMLSVKNPEESGSRVNISVKDGYLYLTGDWQDGDRITLDFPMEIHMAAAHPKVRENVGKVAFTRGPIVYCMEEADNGRDLHLCKVDMEYVEQGLQGIRVEESRELGHRMDVLKVPGWRKVADEKDDAPLYRDFQMEKEEETVLTLIPYYAWGNRGEGEMCVWLRW